jgi:hypothetical protein
MNEASAFVAASPKGNEPSVSAAVEQAWARYEHKLRQLRDQLYSWRAPLSADRQLRVHDLCSQLAAYAYNSIMAPRTDCPRFFLHNHFEPNVYSLVFPCADFNYRVAYVDAHHTYRMWGSVGTSRMMEFQVGAGPIMPIDPAMRKAPLPRSTNFRLEQFDRADDGSFEVIIGGPERRGNWIGLDPTWEQYAIYAREAFYDWEREVPTELHIEALDGPRPTSFLHDEETFISRLRDMGNHLTYLAEFAATDIVDLTLRTTNDELNVFAPSIAANNSGLNLVANFSNMVFDITDESALVIVVPRPAAPYWGITTGDTLLRTTDFVYHQSSINGHQARVDDDGMIRVVLSARDPGVHNWLDPVDVRLGVAQLRQYYASSIVVPEVRVVAFDELSEHLPASTPRIEIAERDHLVRGRRLGRLRLLGY